MELGLGLQITLIGMVTVFATLYLLAEVIKLPQIFFRVKDKNTEGKGEVPAKEAGIPPHHLAAIAGVVASLAKPRRIQTIRIQANENWEQSRYTEITSP